MKTKLIFFISIIALIGSLFLGITFLKKPGQSMISDNKAINSPVKIAILQPVSHPSLEQIKLGFKAYLEEQYHAPIEYKEYNGNGNGTLMRAQAEEAVNSEPTLIFTIATSPAMLIKELTIRKNKLIPVVCGAAAQEKVMPAHEKITHMTGTDDMVVQEEQLSLLKQLKPEAANILLLYDGNSPGLEKSMNDLEKYSTEFGFATKKLPIYALHEISQKIAPFINDVDTILVLKDNLLVSGLDILVKRCNQHGITLMASDLDSVDRGAALGFGVSEYEIGIQSAEQALEILTHPNQAVSQIPFKIITNAKLKINKEAAKLQGIKINK